jgi:hypothetical protein
MNKIVFLCLTITVMMSGCGKKKETLNKEAVNKQYLEILDEMTEMIGVWRERMGDDNMMWGGMHFDVDGDGILEILPYILRHWGGGDWWLWYYESGAWHEASDTRFMQARIEDIYCRKDDVKGQPRLFRRDGPDSVSAIIFDRGKGAVTLEAFDYGEFDDLRKKGIIQPYEDIGQND